VTLQTQVATAQAEVTSATISLDAARVSYERLKKLNAEDKNVSDRVVDEAQLKVRTEQARLNGAKQTLELASAALKAAQMKLAAIPLTVLHGGEVMDVSVHPGEAVESGQPILRVSRFNRVLAAVSSPA